MFYFQHVNAPLLVAILRLILNYLLLVLRVEDKIQLSYTCGLLIFQLKINIYNNL